MHTIGRWVLIYRALLSLGSERSKLVTKCADDFWDYARELAQDINLRLLVRAASQIFGALFNTRTSHRRGRLGRNAIPRSYRIYNRDSENCRRKWSWAQCPLPSLRRRALRIYDTRHTTSLISYLPRFFLSCCISVDEFTHHRTAKRRGSDRTQSVRNVKDAVA